MIEAKNISKIYSSDTHQQYALKHCSFTIEDGELVVILGPSGAGKSTLLNILGGMDVMDEGELIVHRHPIGTLDEQALCSYRAQEIGFIFQFYNLIPTLTAYENVALMKDLKKDCLSPSAVLEEVGLLEHMHKFPAQLSGGEQQRVSIARALCKNPSILLCDEPTGALDSETGKLVLSALQDACHKHHKTTIIVTHNASIAACADRIIRIHNGEIHANVHQDHPMLVKDVEW